MDIVEANKKMEIMVKGRKRPTNYRVTESYLSKEDISRPGPHECELFLYGYGSVYANTWEDAFTQLKELLEGEWKLNNVDTLIKTLLD